MFLGVGIDARISSLWSIPFFVFLPFPLVALLPRELASRNGGRVAAIIAIYAAGMLATGPFARESVLAEARSNAAMPIEQIADNVQTLWHEAVGRPLRVVGGENALFANGTALYTPDRPYAIQANSLVFTPWVSQLNIAQDGAAYICYAASAAGCRDMATSLYGGVDQEIPFSVPAPVGAGGENRWDLVLLIRRPAA